MPFSKSRGAFPALLLLAAATAAEAQTPHQTRYLRALAYAQALQDRCPAWRTSAAVAVFHGRESGVAVGDWERGGRWHATLRREMEAARATMRPVKAEEACRLAGEWFGREGRLLPELMIRE